MRLLINISCCLKKLSLLLEALSIPGKKNQKSFPLCLLPFMPFV